jgi:hypothetical protein
MIGYLIEICAADVSRVSHNGETALLAAQRFAEKNKEDEQLQRAIGLILRAMPKGTAPSGEQKLYYRDGPGHTTLNSLIQIFDATGDVRVLYKELSRIHANGATALNGETSNGRRLLCIVAERDGSMVFSRIKAVNSIDINVRDGGQTPLMFAAAKCHVATVKAILALNPDVFATNLEGDSALALAEKNTTARPADRETVITLLKEAQEKQRSRK